MRVSNILTALALATIQQTHGYSFVGSSSRSIVSFTSEVRKAPSPTHRQQNSSLQMVDSNVIQGAGIAIAGLVAGIGLVAFTEGQGERAKERGSGLSEGMSTRIAGGLLEDVEVSSVKDLGSLTAQLESALKESGGVSDQKLSELELTEEEKKKIAEDADDGW